MIMSWFDGNEIIIVLTGSNHGVPNGNRSEGGGLPIKPEENGEGKDRNQADRKHHQPPSDLLQEEKWSAQKGL